MQLFFFRHRSTSFSSGQNNGLYLLWDGKLRTKSSSSRLERRNTRCNMIAHSVLVEESHLFLYSSINTRITCMKTYHQQTTVIEFFHQSKLFFQCHRCRTTNHSSTLGIISQFHRYQTTGIKYQVCLLKEVFSTNRNQFRIARSSTHYLDMPFPT